MTNHDSSEKPRCEHGCGSITTFNLNLNRDGGGPWGATGPDKTEGTNANYYTEAEAVAERLRVHNINSHPAPAPHPETPRCEVCGVGYWHGKQICKCGVPAPQPCRCGKPRNEHLITTTITCPCTSPQPENASIANVAEWPCANCGQSRRKHLDAEDGPLLCPAFGKMEYKALRDTDLLELMGGWPKQVQPEKPRCEHGETNGHHYGESMPVGFCERPWCPGPTPCVLVRQGGKCDVHPGPAPQPEPTYCEEPHKYVDGVMQSCKNCGPGPTVPHPETGEKATCKNCGHAISFRGAEWKHISTTTWLRDHYQCMTYAEPLRSSPQHDAPKCLLNLEICEHAEVCQECRAGKIVVRKYGPCGHIILEDGVCSNACKESGSTDFDAWFKSKPDLWAYREILHAAWNAALSSASTERDAR